MIKWDVDCAEYIEDSVSHYRRLLAEGWEPFSVTPGEDYNTVWFRRQIQEQR